MLASTEELTEKKQQLSFQQFIEETYLPWYKTQVKESTYLNRRSTIQKHFSYFYKMTVDEIKPSNVQNWQLELAKEFNPNYILPRALEKPAGLAGVHRIKIHALRHPYVKHTTKKYNSEKQKTQATKIDLIAWVFRFCIFNYSKRSWTL